jgi:uncharacterized repeat protein (TIGR03803 family)
MPRLDAASLFKLVLFCAACLAGPEAAFAAPPPAPSVQPDGASANFKVMHDMSYGSGVNSPLVVAQDGKLYGVARFGGLFGDGTIFSMTPKGIFQELHTFEVESEASRPYGLLETTKGGQFYGVTRYGGWSGYGSVYRFSPPDKLTIIHSFHGSDGDEPRGSLIYGTDGALYGITVDGGAFGHGTVFRISLDGAIATLHSFEKGHVDGYRPMSRLLQGPDGAFYGTTSRGGPYGHGTAFRLTPEGDYQVLHAFDGSDGDNILNGLTAGPDGAFYGVSYGGGAQGVGTIFRLSPDGGFAVLFSFERHTTGAHPIGELVLGSDGHFYGVAKAGGRGRGTIYRFSMDGHFSLLHNFDGTDGHDPRAGLVEHKAGEFFGATSEGGRLSRGTIYRIVVK